MLAKLHESLAGKDLGQESADVLTKTLLQQVEDVSKKHQLGTSDWETQMLGALQVSVGVGKGVKTVQAYILAIVEDNWLSLSREFRQRYSFSFDAFVYQETGILPSSMDNNIRAARTFIIKGVKPFGTIEVPKRDADKNVVMENGKPVMQQVEWDPTRVDITKLARLRSAAEKGLMGPNQQFERGWALAMDPVATVSDVDKLLYNTNGSGDTGGSNDPTMKFALEGNRIVVTEFGETVEVAELFFDMGENDIARRAIKHIIRLLDIPYEEDVISKKIHEAKQTILLRIYEAGGDQLIDDTDTVTQ